MILYNLYETYNIQGYHFEFHHCLQHLVGQNILPEKTQSFTLYSLLYHRQQIDQRNTKLYNKRNARVQFQVYEGRFK